MINPYSHLNKGDWQFSNTPSYWLKYPWPCSVTLVHRMESNGMDHFLYPLSNKSGNRSPWWTWWTLKETFQKTGLDIHEWACVCACELERHMGLTDLLEMVREKQTTQNNAARLSFFPKVPVTGIMPWGYKKLQIIPSVPNDFKQERRAV